MSDYIVYMTHDGYIAHDAAFAREIRRRRGIGSVAVVHGRRNRRMAQAENAFDSVVDLMEGFDPASASSLLDRNLSQLREIERATGDTTVMQDVYQDRWLSGRFELPFIAAYLAHAADVLRPICEGRVKAVIGEMTMAVYRLARRLAAGRAPFWYPITARFFPRFYFEDSLYLEWTRCRALYDRFIAHGVPADVEAIVQPVLDGIVGANAAPAMFRHVQSNAALGSQPLLSKVTRTNLDIFVDYWREDIREFGRNPRVLQTPASMLPHAKAKRWVVENRRVRWFRQHALAAVPDGIRFASFFLHYQPEYTIDGIGYPFADQCSLIRTIAQSLPLDTILLVKEQPFMLGLRRSSFYEEIVSMPNVRLVSDTVNGREMVRKSRIVFTVSGTSAIEAMFFNVPAIVFSKVVHAHFRGIKLVENLYSLVDVIREALAEQRDPDVRQRSVAALAAMHQASHPGELTSLVIPAAHTLRDENVRRLGDALEAELFPTSDEAEA